MLDKFLSYLALKGLSPNTLRNYRADLEHLISYAGQRAITERLVRRYLTERRQSGVSLPTIARNLASIRAYYKWLIATGEAERDPSAHIEPPKLPRRLPRPLTVEQMARLLQAARQTGKRNIAIVETLYSTGIRVSELCSLALDDLDLQHGTARVTGKGDKERLVTLGPQAVTAIRQYLDGRPVSRNGQQVFLSRTGYGLQAGAVQRLIKHLGQGIGIEVTPHVFRHSFATHMLDAGCDIRVIQECLGHEDISTTQRYTAVSQTRKQEAFDKAHPRSGMEI